MVTGLSWGVGEHVLLPPSYREPLIVPEGTLHLA